MKKCFPALLLLIVSILTLSVPKAEAATYPNSGLVVSPGDVIYSSKGWQTFFVGHVAIVGDDGKIYHSTPAVASGGVGESLTAYLSRFDSGTTLDVYVYKGSSVGPYLERGKAGKWARENVSKITEYSFTSNLKMSVISSNYCTKFIWQSFYYGADTNIDRPYLGNYKTGTSTSIWTPLDFQASFVMNNVGSFKVS
ncbi:hypothetical protein [Paenibacillus sp. KS-LC4]|uniref:hypothetical protein n=1 Tax=Paenibacillus sp. KS-LC4 TaxID=2979727 RepID=UPI0030CB45BB